MSQSEVTESERALFEVWPSLRDAVALAPLANLPTPLQPLPDLVRAACNGAGPELWVKRDDLTHEVYGGNKVRTLELLFGEALDEGATRVFSTGAYGSNHATATVLHAPRVGMKSGVVLYPQPPSVAALQNLRVTLSARPRIIAPAHWSGLPLGMLRARSQEERAGGRAYVMVPGGATPRGALGYVSAGLELGAQVQRSGMPRPREVVVGVGSNCTSAGLLVGLHLAARLGLGFRDGLGRPNPPRLTSVRVTPWPVTSAFRILDLAVRASAHLATLAQDPSLQLERRDLEPYFGLETRFYGRGYGYPTRTGLEALELWQSEAKMQLDTTYSAKSAACVLARLRSGATGPIVYWATKSTAPLPPLSPEAIADAPRAMQRWLHKAKRRGPDRPARPLFFQSDG